MKIYLIKNNEVQGEYTNIIKWASNFVEFENGINCRCKIYCDTENGEYFTDKEILC